jgi:hypothetical protein
MLGIGFYVTRELLEGIWSTKEDFLWRSIRQNSAAKLARQSFDHRRTLFGRDAGMWGVVRMLAAGVEPCA